jgi:hypothetical protein
MIRAQVLARLKSLEPKLRASGVEALYLYGSYARDDAGPDSDLDILADFSAGRDKDFLEFLAPIEELERAFPETEIGFSTRDRLEPLYRAAIESSAIRVF